MAGIINKRKGGLVKKVTKGVTKKVGRAVMQRTPIGMAYSVAKTAGKLAKRAVGVKAVKRHKRMNVANIRALKRAIKRVKGFAKVSSQSINISKRVKVRRRR